MFSMKGATDAAWRLQEINVIKISALFPSADCSGACLPCAKALQQGCITQPRFIVDLVAINPVGIA